MRPAVVSDDAARFHLIGEPIWTVAEASDISRDMLRLFGDQDAVNLFVFDRVVVEYMESWNLTWR